MLWWTQGLDQLLHRTGYLLHSVKKAKKENPVQLQVMLGEIISKENDEENEDNLNKFHEKVNIFSIEFSREILDCLMKILSQWVRFTSNGELVPSYLFYVSLRRRHVQTLIHKMSQCQECWSSEGVWRWRTENGGKCLLT